MSDLKVYAVDLSVNFVGFVSERIKSLAGKYKKIFVVFPNLRPLRFVEKRLSLKTLLKTDLYSMPDFVKFVVSEFSEKPPVFQDEIDRLMLILGILKKNRDVYNSLGGEDYKVFPWVKKLSSLFSEIDIQLLESVKDFEYFDQTVDEARKLLENLNSLYGEYRKRVEEENLSYGGDLYKRCVSLVEGEGFENSFEDTCFLFAGFSYLANSEEKIVKAIGESFYTEICFQTDTGKSLHSIGDAGFNVYGIYRDWFSGKKWGTKPEIVKSSSVKPEVFFYESYDVHSEVRQFVKVFENCIKEIGENSLKNPTSVGIILPDSKTLFPLLFYFSKSAGKDFPKNITLSFPFHKTGFGDFLEKLFKVLVDMEANRGRKVYVPLFLKLLKSEIIKLLNLQADLSYVDEVYNFLIENNVVFLDFDKLDDIFGGKSDLKVFVGKIFEKILKPFADASSFAKLYEVFSSFYLLVDRKTLSDEENYFNLQILDFFFSSVVARLEILGKRDELKNIEYSQRLFYSVINILAKSISVPFEGNPLEGVQIMGMLESRSLSFDYLFILDVNEGILPNAEKIDPLMPESLKTALGLSGFKEREQLIKYNFFRLVDSSKKVFLFFQTGQTSLEKKIKSRYVEQLILEKQFENLDKKGRDFLKGDIVEKAESSLSPALLNIPLKIKECGFKGGIEKSDWIKDEINSLLNGKISPTFLDDFLNCPYMFYLKKVAKIEERITLEESQRADKVGTLIHYLLEKGFMPYRGKAIDFAILEKVESEIISEFNLFIDEGRFEKFKMDGEIEDVSRYLKNLEEIKKEMLKTVAIHRLESLFSGFKKDCGDKNIFLESLEETVEYDGFEYDGKKIKLYGKIDRVEKIEDGGEVYYRIIDYKTGAYAKTPFKTAFARLLLSADGDENCVVKALKRGLNSIQLPFYIYIFSKSRGEDYHNVKSFLYMLGESSFKSDRHGFDFSAIPNFSGLEDFETILTVLFDAIFKSDIIPATPSDRCKYCNYRHFCSFAE